MKYIDSSFVEMNIYILAAIKKMIYDYEICKYNANINIQIYDCNVKLYVQLKW